MASARKSFAAASPLFSQKQLLILTCISALVAPTLLFGIAVLLTGSLRAGILGVLIGLSVPLYLLKKVPEAIVVSLDIENDALSFGINGSPLCVARDEIMDIRIQEIPIDHEEVEDVLSAVILIKEGGGQIPITSLTTIDHKAAIKALVDWRSTPVE